MWLMQLALQEWTVDHRVLAIDVIQAGEVDVRVVVALENVGFRVYALNSPLVQDIPHTWELGVAIKCVELGDTIVLCYTSNFMLHGWISFVVRGVDCGVHLMNGDLTCELQRYSWRSQPLLFASKLLLPQSNGAPLLVVGSASTVDIWSIDAAKIVHIFETKKDRIKSLQYLFTRLGKIFLMASEEKDGAKCSSVIYISEDKTSRSSSVASLPLDRLIPQ